jgi:hypothetical protein
VVERKSKSGETNPLAPRVVPEPDSPPTPVPVLLARGTGPLAAEAEPAEGNVLFRRLTVALSAPTPARLGSLKQLVHNAGRSPATLSGADLRMLEGSLRTLANAHPMPYERALVHAKLDALMAELT